MAPLLVTPSAADFFNSMFVIECPRCYVTLDLKAMIYRKNKDGIIVVHKLPPCVYCLPCKKEMEAEAETEELAKLVEPVWIHLDN